MDLELGPRGAEGGEVLRGVAVQEQFGVQERVDGTRVGLAVRHPLLGEDAFAQGRGEDVVETRVAGRAVRGWRGPY
ncbi:hypothetical protein [Nonomuraea sp. bgisy101]|uniref:hypothetical protein n=1 Tax=Nonomuraea sp. bgisy101 TaxID=3413784 RepID=UPI003D70908C